MKREIYSKCGYKFVTPQMSEFCEGQLSKSKQNGKQKKKKNCLKKIKKKKKNP